MKYYASIHPHYCFLRTHTLAQWHSMLYTLSSLEQIFTKCSLLFGEYLSCLALNFSSLRTLDGYTHKPNPVWLHDRMRTWSTITVTDKIGALTLRLFVWVTCPSSYGVFDLLSSEIASCSSSTLPSPWDSKLWWYCSFNSSCPPSFNTKSIVLRRIRTSFFSDCILLFR